MPAKAGPADIEIFKEDLAANVKHCIRNVEVLESESDQEFVLGICQHYEDTGWLSNKQLTYLVPHWQDINKRL